MAFVVKSKDGTLGMGSSITLPGIGPVKIGCPINGAKGELEEKLEVFYPGRFEVVKE